MNIALSYLTEASEQGIIDRLKSYSDAEGQLADPDYWGSVGIISLTGILVVFFILAILIFVFWLMGKVFVTAANRKKSKALAEKAAAEKAAAKPEPAAPAPAVEAASDEADYDDDEEIMAVISAAIAAYAEQDGTSYTIKDVRRMDSRTRSAWSLAGIGENTRPF